MAGKRKSKKAKADEKLVAIDKSAYTKEKTASGKTSIHNGDDVATLLAGLDIKAVHTIAKNVLGENTKSKYAHLNVGMQRMNVGNRLRKAANDDAKVAKQITKEAKAAAKAA